MHPVLVRRMISPMLERCLGRRTFGKWRHLRDAQWWSAGQIADLQNAKLARLFSIARNHCPFYRERFSALGLRSDGDDQLAELRKLPPIDKTTIRKNLARMTNHTVRGGLYTLNTGGSTGEPLTFYVDRRRMACDKAARMLTHAWYDVLPGDREVYLWGAPAELNAQDRLKQLRDRVTNELLLEAFNMSPARIASYIGQINRFEPRSIFGYPSSLSLLAAWCQRNHLPFLGQKLAAVFTTGEVLDDQDRERIQRFFGAPVANGYGSRDGGFIAHQCPHGRMHIMAHHLIVEVVDDKGRLVPPGNTGEIVVTHLDAHATLFIRYRTGDLGVISHNGCPCGRRLAILERVCGRRTDQLVAADGSLQHALSAIYVLRELQTIKRFQIRQHADRSVDVRVVPSDDFTATDRYRIRDGIARQLGRSLTVRVKLVDHIKTAASGKFRQVVSDAAGFLSVGGDWPAGLRAREHTS